MSKSVPELSNCEYNILPGLEGKRSESDGVARRVHRPSSAKSTLRGRRRGRLGCGLAFSASAVLTNLVEERAPPPHAVLQLLGALVKARRVLCWLGFLLGIGVVSPTKRLQKMVDVSVGPG